MGSIQQEPWFRSSISFRVRQPTDTFHPHYLSVYASTLDFGGGRLIPTLQNSILGVWLTLTQAGFPPASLQDIASPHVHVMVRSRIVEAANEIMSEWTIKQSTCWPAIIRVISEDSAITSRTPGPMLRAGQNRAHVIAHVVSNCAQGVQTLAVQLCPVFCGDPNAFTLNPEPIDRIRRMHELIHEFLACEVNTGAGRVAKLSRNSHAKLSEIGKLSRFQW